MTKPQITDAIKAITDLLRLNQHPATQLSVSTKKQAEMALHALLQYLN